MATWKTADGIGGLEVLEVFGNDLTVVNAARVSFAKESEEFNERDAGLIRYLAKHHHTSPFFPSADSPPRQNADFCGAGMVPAYDRIRSQRGVEAVRGHGARTLGAWTRGTQGP